MDKTKAIEEILAGMHEIAPGQGYEIGPFTPEDAPGVARLFYDVYGDAYPVAGYYDPDWLVRANADGTVHAVVARTTSGDVLGQFALYRSSPPNPRLYEIGQMLVLKAYRNTFLAFKLQRYMLDVHIPRVNGVDGIFSESVCHHLVTQKMGVKSGYGAGGLEVGLMPEEAYAGEGAVGRVSCMFTYKTVHDTRQTIHLPARYREAMEFALDNLGLDREPVFAETATFEPGSSEIESERFDFAKVMRVQVRSAATDFPETMRAICRQAEEHGLAMVEVFVIADRPSSVAAVEALRAMGFFLGGLAPIWTGADAIFMQRLWFTPDFDGLKLFGEQNTRMAALVRADYESVTTR